MKNLFCKLEIISISVLGKKDKKSINKIWNKEILKKTEDYQLVKLKNRANLVLDNNKALLFHFNNKYIPTIKSIEEGLLDLPSIYLDNGAVGPLQRGANVMAPGIFKYINLGDDFIKNDVLCIKIIDQGILAIGMALIDKKSINKNTGGEAIVIVHINNDELYSKY